jgi:hypothetical protein
LVILSRTATLTDCSTPDLCIARIDSRYAFRWCLVAGFFPTWRTNVFQALNIDRSYIDAVEKAYNPAEPRVPAGSGRTSGEWTDSEQTNGTAVALEGAAERTLPDHHSPAHRSRLQAFLVNSPRRKWRNLARMR